MCKMIIQGLECCVPQLDQNYQLLILQLWNSNSKNNHRSMLSCCRYSLFIVLLGLTLLITLCPTHKHGHSPPNQRTWQSCIVADCAVYFSSPFYKNFQTKYWNLSMENQVNFFGCHYESSSTLKTRIALRHDHPH